jgi:tetratricopeptide (TPR) repeat protein
MINKLEKSSFIILLVTIILAPLVFIPSKYVPLDMVKTIVITIGVLVSSILYFFSILKNRELLIPKHSVFVLACCTIISLIISTLLSSNILKSFFGQGFEIATTSFVLVSFLSTLLVIYLTYKDRNRITYIYKTIFISFSILVIFHITRLLGMTDFVLFDFLQTTTSTILGKWNDIAILSGIVFILHYLSLKFVITKPITKYFSILVMVISGLFIFIVNSSIIWSVMLLVFVSMWIYEYYISHVNFGSKEIKVIIKNIPIITSILIISVSIMLWKGGDLAMKTTQKLNIQSSELLLPWQLTLDVVSNTVKESPLFGAGPNRFGAQYLKYKPLMVNQTPFWNTEFNSGFSLVSTYAVNQGVVGLVLWILLLALYAYTGFNSLKKIEDDIAKFFVTSTFFTSFFLWIISLVYVPSHTIVFLTFIFTGLFISSLIQNGQSSLVKIGDNKNIISKFIPLIIIVILAICILWLAVYIKKTLALTYFQSGISSLNIPNGVELDKAEKAFKKALSIDKIDNYYQALSEVNILRITTLAQEIQSESQKTGKVPNQDSVKVLGGLVDEATQYTKNAINIDPTNYYNYLAQARIYSVALTLQVPGAYDATKTAYMNAIKYNPYDPSLYLSLARVEATQNKLAEAQKYIGNSLQLKQNYLDAIFLLSQIQISQNQIKDAIISVQVASQINPTNPLIFFQLGFLHYNDKNYQAAIDSLSTAIKLDKMYANAQYFLGLSYARLNKIQDAIIQFEALTITNPDNQEVRQILSNLRNGKLPFSDVKPPIDSKPEKRGSLPIKEKIKPRS